jgi:hypothetical protein
MPEKSILDARLAEIDRRLQTIQAGLEPAARAAPAAPSPDASAPGAPVAAPGLLAAVIPPEAAPAPKRLSAEDRQVSDLVARLTVLVEAHERLLASASEPVAGPAASVSVGPFDGTEALRRFERSLQALPEVRSASVREYEGADRAVVDVHLYGPTS